MVKVIMNPRTHAGVQVQFVSIYHVLNTLTRATQNIDRQELSAAVLDLAVKRLDQETIKNNDLVRREKSILK